VVLRIREDVNTGGITETEGISTGGIVMTGGISTFGDVETALRRIFRNSSVKYLPTSLLQVPYNYKRFGNALCIFLAIPEMSRSTS